MAYRGSSPISAPGDSYLNRLRHTSETASVEFIDENGGGPGVRLRKSGKA